MNESLNVAKKIVQPIKLPINITVLILREKKYT